LRVLAAPLLLALLLVSIAARPAVAATTASGSRPNIVFILTDDLDAASYDPAQFPALRDLMTTQGVTFSNFFVDDSLCCPSRASILRGQYVHDTRVLNNGAPTGGFQAFHHLGRESSTVATWLHARGYRTGLFGKYLNGYPDTVPPRYVPPGWDVWASPSGGNPYGEYRYELNENGKLVQYGHQPDDYLVDVLARHTVHFITQSAGKRPFFAYVAPYVPHEPATPAPRYADAFPGVRAPRTPSFDQAVFHDEPNWLSARPPLSPLVLAYIDTLYRRRLQDMLGVEDLLREVVATLQRTGQLANTYIFLGSDNGFHLGQHRLPPGKETAYDEDIRVPLVVRGPGVPRGTTVNQFAMNDDLAPTFAALGGAETPSFVDGRSLVPLLHSGPAPPVWRQAALVEHYGPSPTNLPSVTRPTTTTQPPSVFLPGSPTAPRDPDDDPAYNRAAIRGPRRLPLSSLNAFGIRVPSYDALRTPRYLYVEYFDGERQLYDLRRDPYEMTNVVTRVPASVRTALSRQLEALEQCHGASCRRIEDGSPPG
jgi:N-acetylglucosamine-6-sulfatase